MTLKSDSVVSLSLRDWVAIIALIVGGSLSIGTAYFDIIEKLNRNNNELMMIRTEWNVEAPSPAKWTKEAITRIDSLNAAQDFILRDHEKRITNSEQHNVQ